MSEKKVNQHEISDADAAKWGLKKVVLDDGSVNWEQAPPPKPWINKEDKEGRKGYFNTETNEFSYRRPGTSFGGFKLPKGSKGLSATEKKDRTIAATTGAVDDDGPTTEGVFELDKSKGQIKVHQTWEDRAKQVKAQIIVAVLRKMTGEKATSYNSNKPQLITLLWAYDALGMLRSIAYTEQVYNACFDQEIKDATLRTYMQRPYLEMLSGFGDRPKSLKVKSTIFGLSEVIKIVEDHYADELADADKKIKSGLVDFNGLVQLYRPGTICLYQQGVGAEIGLKCMWCKYERGKSLFGVTRVFHVGFQFIASVGGAFTPIDFFDYIFEFKGDREISKLPFVPLSSMKDSDMMYWLDHLSERGKTYNKYAVGEHFIGYGKESFFQFSNSQKGAHVNRQSGRVMLDTSFAYENNHVVNMSNDYAVNALRQAFGTYKRFKKQFKPPTGNNEHKSEPMAHITSSKADIDDGDMILFHTIPDELLYTTWPTICGFSFSGKCWGQVAVSNLQPIQFNEHAFQQLVLPVERKHLIKALVQYSNDSFSDIIRGKGEGSVFLLYGPPGVGKTLTAEAISEMLGRPLYQISMGELGENAAELETRLQDVFRVCARWNALVLLDEADTFVEKRRSDGSIARNAMVSVMLRLIEYFQGVLFLTTNRVKSFDPAFQTRITVALKYNALDEAGRAKVWSNLLTVSGHGKEVEDGKIKLDELAKSKMNGREIKNAIRLALALAKQDNNVLTQQHLLTTVGICSSFHDELADAEEY